MRSRRWFGGHYHGGIGIGRGRVKLSIAPADRGEFGIGLRQRYSCPQARQHIEIPDPGAEPLRRHKGKLEVARKPDARRAGERELDIGGQNADDGVWRGIERNRFPDDAGVGVELGPPHGVGSG